MISFVLDNSVAMRWCFDGVSHSYADSVLKRIAGSATAIVPFLWFYEANAVLAREQNRGRLAASKAADFIQELLSLRIIPDEKTPVFLFSEIFRLATLYKLTSYDAAYLELALRRGLPLATLDD